MRVRLSPAAQSMKLGEDYIGVCVVFFCHDGGGKFIMAKRNGNARDDQNCWDIGGGALEFGQSVEEALHTEIQQEYSTQIKSYEFLGYRDVHRMNHNVPTHWIALDFKVLVDSTLVKIGEPHKFDAIDWFTLDSLPAKTHSQFPEFLRLYEEHLRQL